MKFIINKKIVFHVNDSKIELLNDTIEPITLSTTLCRLLALLVRNNNLLLSKDFILSSAWDEYGKKSSNSNLNNYISMLRKTFSSLGENDIIVTVPREGFMFAAAEVHTLDGESTSVSLPVVESETIIEALPVATHASKKKWWVAAMLMLAIVTALFCVSHYWNSDYAMADKIEIGKVDQCSLVVLTSPDIVKVSKEKQEMVKLIDKLGLDCRSPATVYHFNSEISSTLTGFTDVISYLSFCPDLRLRGLEAKCENYYEVIKK